MQLTKNSRIYKEKWFEFRNNIIERDDDMCVKCGRSELEGAILQVHHKKYLKGHLPWEYPHDLCETLCQGCHAAEHGKIRPKFGWEFLFDEDLGDLSGTCDLCGSDLRYVFYVHHSDWDIMGVGMHCCDYLTESEIASNLMESKKRYSSRMERFIKSKRWRMVNGVHKIVQKKFPVQVYPSGNGFRINIYGCNGKTIYNTLETAKEKAFEVIESGAAEQYIRKIIQKIYLA